MVGVEMRCHGFFTYTWATQLMSLSIKLSTLFDDRILSGSDNNTNNYACADYITIMVDVDDTGKCRLLSG